VTAMWARQPSPKTPAQAEGRGRTTRLRGATRAPRPTSTAWWAALTALLALLVAAYTLWSLL
jgi:hypothetical protein